MMSFWCTDDNVLHVPPGQERAMKGQIDGNRIVSVAIMAIDLDPLVLDMWMCCVAWSCSLGLQSKSNHPSSQWGGEGRSRQSPAASLLWSEGYLSTTTALSETIINWKDCFFCIIIILDNEPKQMKPPEIVRLLLLSTIWLWHNLVFLFENTHNSVTWSNCIVVLGPSASLIPKFTWSFSQDHGLKCVIF